MSDIDKLTIILQEADLLLAKHDGVHNMHGARANLYTWLEIAKDNENQFKVDPIVIDWENVNLMIMKMRICDKTSFYP